MHKCVKNYQTLQKEVWNINKKGESNDAKCKLLSNDGEADSGIC